MRHQPVPSFQSFTKSGTRSDTRSSWVVENSSSMVHGNQRIRDPSLKASCCAKNHTSRIEGSNGRIVRGDL